MPSASSACSGRATSPHHVRLAVLVEDDRSHVHGRPRRRAPRDPRGQRAAAVRLRRLSAPVDRPVDIVIERDVPVVMRDGVTLRANVYRPAVGGPFPVITERTPYGKDAPRPSAAIDAVPCRRPRRRRRRPGRARAGRLRRRLLLHVPRRVRRRLRHRRVGRRAALQQRPRRAVRHVVRRQHGVAGGDRGSTRARRHRADAGTDRLRRGVAVARHATASSSGG